MTGHGYLCNFYPAFPGNSLCDRISGDPNFRKIYFLITWASQYHYQQIPGNPPVKIFMTEIHGESHPISMRILVTHLTTWYFTCDFSRKYLTPLLEDFSLGDGP